MVFFILVNVSRSDCLSANLQTWYIIKTISKKVSSIIWVFQSFLDGLLFLLRSLAVIVTEEVPGRSSVEVRGLAANEYGNPADDGTEDNLTRVPVNYESSLVIYHIL